MWNDNSVPLNATVVQGSYNYTGLATIVTCTLVVGTDTPNGRDGDTSTISYDGHVKCNTGNIAKSGSVSLYKSNVGTSPIYLASVGLVNTTPQTAYAEGTYVRGSTWNEQVRIDVALTLPDVPFPKWTTYPGGCTPSGRTVHCTLWSPLFKYAIYPDHGEQFTEDALSNVMPLALETSHGQGIDDPVDLLLQRYVGTMGEAAPISITVPAGTNPDVLPEWARQLPAFAVTPPVAGQEVTYYSDNVAVTQASVIEQAEAASYSDCARGWVCLWDRTHYRGRRAQFQESGIRQYLGNYGFNNKTSSWRNRRGRYVVLYDQCLYCGGGERYCMGKATGYNYSPVMGWFNNRATDIYIGRAREDLGDLSCT